MSEVTEVNEMIYVDVQEVKCMSSVSGLGEASARFCYAAAGLPNEVVASFLDLLETYSASCSNEKSSESPSWFDQKVDSL